MSKIENITGNDVKDIFRLAQPYYKKSHEVSNYELSMMVKNPLCSLALSKKAFPVPHDFPEVKDGCSVLLLLNDLSGDFFVSKTDTMLLRTAVLDVVDQYVDRKKYTCCYQRAFESGKEEVVFVGQHVSLNALEHATRLLLLCGIEQAELYDIGDSFVFAGRYKGEFAAAVKIDKRVQWEAKGKCPVVNIPSGSLSFSASSEICTDLIHSSIKAIDAANETAEEYDYLFKKLYDVELVMRTDVFVLAHSEEEAREIALEDVDVNFEFTNGLEVEYCSKAKVESVPTRGECLVYCDGGPMGCEEFHELMKDGTLLGTNDDEDEED